MCKAPSLQEPYKKPPFCVAIAILLLTTNVVATVATTTSRIVRLMKTLLLLVSWLRVELFGS